MWSFSPIKKRIMKYLGGKGNSGYETYFTVFYRLFMTPLVISRYTQGLNNLCMHCYKQK